MRRYPRISRRRHEPVIDVLPEKIAYADNGCDVSPSCLRCPMALCKYDDMAGWQRYRLRRRDEVRLMMAQGKGDIATVSLAMGVSTRTVHRILARTRERSFHGPSPD